MGVFTDLLRSGAKSRNKLFGVPEAQQAAREQELGYEQAANTLGEAGTAAQQRYAPYQQTSTDANRLIQAAMAGDYSGFTESPDYQFRLRQGEKALERAAAAQGRSLSGAQLKALTEHGQGLASTEYGNWYNRLAALRGEGIGITNNLANIGLTTAQGVAGAQQGAAGARASGYMAEANVNNYMARSIHESGQKIGEAWAAPGMMMGGG